MSGWELMKQSSQDPNVSGKSSRNCSACGGRYKETLIASGTSASEELKKFSQLSLSTEGKHISTSVQFVCYFVNTLMNYLVLKMVADFLIS
jgi:hypothetical protein